MDYAHLGTAIAQLVVMAMFVTGGVEVVEDFWSFLRIAGNRMANWTRTTEHKVMMNEADIFLSAKAKKRFAFIIGAVLCYAFEYGAISDILSQEDEIRKAGAFLIDALLTGGILRMGGGGIFDLFSMLTTRIQAVKAEAAKLIPPVTKP